MSRARSPTFPSLYLRHSSFSNPSVALPSSQLILRHSSFFNPSVASTTSQLFLQPFFRISYVTGSSLCHLARRPWLKVPNPRFANSDNSTQEYLVLNVESSLQQGCNIQALLLLFCSQAVRNPSRRNLSLLEIITENTEYWRCWNFRGSKTSYDGRWSSRTSATNFTLLSSIDVLSHRGLGS